MTGIGAAARLAAVAVFSTIVLAGPASAQGGGMASGRGIVASNVRQVPAPTSRPGAFEPGGFPMLGLPTWQGVSRGKFGGYWRHRPERPDRPNRPDRPGRPDRPDRHDRDWHDFDHSYVYGSGVGVGGLIAPSRGYFTSGGEAWRGRDGRLHYDYDRGYPYDHYQPRERRQIAERAPRPERSCETVWARGGRAGDGVPVTVCRN